MCDNFIGGARPNHASATRDTSSVRCLHFAESRCDDLIIAWLQGGSTVRTLHLLSIDSLNAK